MSNAKLICPSLTGMPWQDRPQDCAAPVWRYGENPVIGRNPIPGVARIFNSAVAPYEDGYIGVFRGEQTNGVPYIYLGRSTDGVKWDFERSKIDFVDRNGNPAQPVYAYDPRLVKVEDTYYAMWCQDFQYLPRPRTSRPSPGWKIPSFPSTATRCSFPARSTACTSCCPGPPTRATPPSGTFFSARARTWSSGIATAM